MASADNKAAILAKYRATTRFKAALKIIEADLKHPEDREECECDIAQSLRRVDNAARIDKRSLTPAEQREHLWKLLKTLRKAINLAVRVRPWDYSRNEDLERYYKDIEIAALESDLRKGTRKFSNKRLYAVRQANLLFKKYGKRPTRYRLGDYHKLAKVLFGDEEADLFDTIEEYEGHNWFSHEEI